MIAPLSEPDASPVTTSPEVKKEGGSPATSPVDPQSLSSPSFTLTARQQKQWDRCKSHLNKALFVTESSGKGFANVSKVTGVTHLSHMLPKTAKQCLDSNPNAAKHCNSLHLTSFFAGMGLHLTSTFSTCWSCDNRKNFVGIDAECPSGCIVANIHPDSGVHVLVCIRYRGLGALLCILIASLSQ
jgi:hypothetical protein